jgi:Endoribonuclease L-PSP
MTMSHNRKDVYPIGKKNPNLPFHPAVRAGDFIFVSGQVAKDANGNMIAGTIEEETAGTIESIKRVLAEEGATLADVVRVTPISRIRATSDATTRCSLNISKTRCWRGRPSKPAPSFQRRLKWTPSLTSQSKAEHERRASPIESCRRDEAAVTSGADADRRARHRRRFHS